MTKEEAIKILEKDMKNATDAYSYHLAGGGVIDCELEDYFDAMYSAMDALREQESRAKKTSDKKTSDKKTSEWISVEERLPEPYQTVLVRRRHIDASDCYTTTDHIVPVYGDNKMWAGTARTWKLGVTHWMPLPEPPEVEV